MDAANAPDATRVDPEEHLGGGGPLTARPTTEDLRDLVEGRAEAVGEQEQEQRHPVGPCEHLVEMLLGCALPCFPSDPIAFDCEHLAQLFEGVLVLLDEVALDRAIGQLARRIGDERR